jgi:hypothetical protein
LRRNFVKHCSDPHADAGSEAFIKSMFAQVDIKLRRLCWKFDADGFIRRQSFADWLVLLTTGARRLSVGALSKGYEPVFDSKIAVYVLEAGIAVHSVIIGLSLGVTQGEVK